MTAPAPLTVGAETWFRRYHRTEDARARLLCFAHAGGSASFWFPVARAFADELDVVAVQYPGRQDRRDEPTIDDVHRLADAVAAELPPVLDDGLPLVVLGHSMGAVVAYEVALRLQDAGTTPLRFVASGRRAPSDWRPEHVHTLDDDGLIAALKALSGTDAAMLDDPEVVELVLPAVRGDYRAVETYRCTPGGELRCPVSVLTGDADPMVPVADASGWSDHTRAPTDVRVFGGGHFFLAERADEVLAYLRARLRADLAGPAEPDPAGTTESVSVPGAV